MWASVCVGERVLCQRQCSLIELLKLCCIADWPQTVQFYIRLVFISVLYNTLCGHINFEALDSIPAKYHHRHHHRRCCCLIWIRNEMIVELKTKRDKRIPAIKPANDFIHSPVTVEKWNFILRILLAMIMMMMHLSFGQFNARASIHNIYYKTVQLFDKIYITSLVLNRLKMRIIYKWFHSVLCASFWCDVIIYHYMSASSST